MADRESDIYDVFKRARDEHYRVLLRAAQDRRVEGEHSTLWAQVASFPPVGEARPLSVPPRPAKEGKPARAARDTTIVIRYGLVTLREPQKSGTLDMYAVQVTEVDPPAGVEPIEWLLLTSDPIGDFNRVLAGDGPSSKPALQGRALCKKCLGDTLGAQLDLQRARQEFPDELTVEAAP